MLIFGFVKIAKGEETSNLAGGNQPAASNMRKLVWNDELAVIAQRWADQCTFEHDESRHKADGTKAGQNLFLKGSSNQYTFEEVRGYFLNSFVTTSS